MLPLVIRIKDADSQPPMEKQYVFKQSPVRIGRNQLNDIPINRPFVSLFHALVRFDQASIYMVDLGSTNGVNVGGQRIEKNVPVRIKPGMDVTIGSVQFHFSRDSKAVRDTSSRLTQFRALSEIQSEALSFKPTPVQDRKAEVRTSLLPSLDSLLAQEQDEVTGKSPRTLIAPALQVTDSSEESTSLEIRTVVGPPPELEAPQPKRQPPVLTPTPPGGKKKTGNSQVGVIPRAPGGAAALQDTIQQLVPLYNAYRTAWKMLHQGLSRGVDSLPEQDREQLITQLLRRMPDMAQEPAFQEIAKNVGRPVDVEPATVPMPAVHSGAANRMEVVSRELLNQFVRSYLPDTKGLQSEQDIQGFLEHLAELLETFGRAFVELRQGNDQFGQQMAVPVTNEDNPLSRMKSPREVLRYLLDFKVSEASHRVQELMGGFGDMMIHQIAVLSGLREGVKDVLDRLSPERLEVEVSGVWPFGLSKRWAKYSERHRAFVEEERELTAVLFGPEFAKAYLAIVGESANKGGVGDEDADREMEES
ncbi:type VI secretion system-associated FHA domain protein [Hyalangium rubrum]|uniref:Type VI secretion system-associated FHA domain protein n=1 Tax=Hyalangium rubrum TaxID=3103134 RepID=A0ABU5HCW8_9BACT|nr:type VI secretion system-associated FHA domain protein [Hyalangium sp. s54d21]MDY7230949.1 type VI secretion system-associated FHA domain protein [Hyalangium sp. s54d21]